MSEEIVSIFICLIDAMLLLLSDFLKNEGVLPSEVKHLQIKYRNNQMETDHGKLKRLINPVRGFQSMKTACATIKGFEVMRMFKKGQFNVWMVGNRNEISFINSQFGLYS